MFYQDSLSPATGYGDVAELTLDRKTYMITTHAFDRFCERAPDAGIDKNKNKNKRDYLRRFVELFKEASPVKRVNSRKQVERHGEESKYRLNENWIFVINSKNIIKTCYWKTEALPYQMI
jgi:hypothetical protein